MCILNFEKKVECCSKIPPANPSMFWEITQ